MIKQVLNFAILLSLIFVLIAVGSQFLPWAYRVLIHPSPGNISLWEATAYLKQGRDALKKCQPELYERVRHKKIADGFYQAADELGVTYSRPGHPVSDLLPRIAKAARQDRSRHEQAIENKRLTPEPTIR